MGLPLTTVSKKILSYLFKAILVGLAFAFIYFEYLEKGDNLKQFETLVAGLNPFYVNTIIIAVFVLMLANWLLECGKWQYLARHLAPLTLWQSVEGVFCGLTWAIFTPNRIGEYGGRLLFLPSRKRVHGFFAMSIGAFAQLVATVVMGSIAIIWFAYQFLNLTGWAFRGLTFIAILTSVVFLIFYFNIKWLARFLNAIPFLKKHQRFFQVIGTYKFNELMAIMWFSLARYLAFSLQYYLLIHMLIPGIPFHQVFLLVFVILFVRSVIPSLDLIDVAVRSAVATSIFGYVTDQDVAIIAIFTAIWFINLVIPAILGCFFILKLKFFDRNV